MCVQFIFSEQKKKKAQNMEGIRNRGEKKMQKTAGEEGRERERERKGEGGGRQMVRTKEKKQSEKWAEQRESKREGWKWRWGRREVCSS